MWKFGLLHRLGVLSIALSLSGMSCSAPSGGGGGDDGGDNGGDNGGQDNGGGGGSDGGDASQPDSEPFPDSDGVAAIFQTTQPLNGVVQLPDGFDLSATDLKVVSLNADMPVSAGGTFNGEITVPSGTRSLTAVVDSRNRVVLLGHIHPFDNARNPINTESTAIALLYFALGGWTTPYDTFDDIYDNIRYDYATAVDIVESALNAALADNPAALAEGDERINNAIQEAQDILLTASNALTAKHASPKAKFAPVNLQSAEGFITAMPGPTTAQNGLFLRNDTAGGGLVGLNTLPRRGRFLTYKTGFESGGIRTDLSPVELVGAPVSVPSAFTTGSSGGILFNLETQLDGGFPWKNISTESFSIDMHPGATVTYYDILLLSATLNHAGLSPLFQEPKYAVEDDRWMTELADLQNETFYLDYLIPVAEIWALGASLLPEDAPDLALPDESQVQDTSGSRAVLGLPDATRIAMLTETQALCDPVISGISLTTAQGYSDALGAILARAGSDSSFRAALTDILYRAYGPNNHSFLNFPRMQQGLLNMASTFSLVASVQFGIGKVSLGSVTEQLQASTDISRWSATVSAVRLLPASPVVTEKYPTEPLSAQVNGAHDGEFCYRWSTSGRIGTLIGGGTGEEGTMFSSASGQISYVADPGGISKTPNLDSVTVEIYDMANLAGGTADCDNNAASGLFVGSATVTIAGDERDDACVNTNFDPSLYNVPGPLTMSVSPRTVLPGDTVTVTINYDFAAAGTDPSGYASVAVYLPFGCSFCWSPERRCICNQEDRATLRVDGQDNPGNVSTTEFVTGIGGGVADPNFRPLRSTCLSGFSPLNFILPDPEVREVITHVIEYRVSPDFTPCPLDRPDCYCPRLIQEPVYTSTGLVWSGPFVIAQAGLFSSGLAVELLNMGTDPAYDPETHVTCPADE